MIRLSLLVLAAAAALSGQPDSFIITARPTKAALNSVRALAGGTLLYSDAYGVFRVRGQQVETLLANPVQEERCGARMFGWFCVYWAPAVYHPKPMAADASGRIYIADPELHTIQRYDPGAKAFVVIARDVGAPTSLAADDWGNVYFNDPQGCRVRRLSQGAVDTAAGTGTCGYTNDGGPATEAQILSVRAIAVDAAGQLYIADDKAGVVRRVDASGIITTVVGTGMPGYVAEGTPARFTPLSGPAGVAVDAQGNLYIADAGSNRVRMLGADGLVRTVAGTGGPGHSGDYGLAAAAQLTAPSCMAVTESGALLICDTDRIRKLIPGVPGRWILPVVSSPESPGALISGWRTLLGEFAGAATTDWSSAIGPDGSLPTTLAGVTAFAAGKACILSYVSPDRIDLLLPAELAAPAPPPQTLTLVWPGGTANFSVAIGPSAPEFLMAAGNGKLYPAAMASGSWITPDRPARAGETIALYVTGLNISAPVSPPYGVTEPGWAQVVIRSYGYRVLQARPFSLGVAEVTVQLPADLPAGEHPIRLIYDGYFSRAQTVLPVGGGN